MEHLQYAGDYSRRFCGLAHVINSDIGKIGYKHPTKEKLRIMDGS